MDGNALCRLKWAGGLLLSMLLAAPGAAQETIEQRLERLEKQNAEIRKQADELQKQNQELKALVGSSPASTTVGPEEVQRLIAAYLAAQEEKGKGGDGKAGEAKGDKKPSGPAWYEVGSDTNMPGKWTSGRLNFESKNKDFRAHLGGRTQFDTYAIGAPQSFITAFPNGSFDDNMFFRRVRIEFDGTAYENVEWDFQVDLERNTLFERNQAGVVIANGNFPPARFDDMWVGLKNLPIIGNIRIGHVRPPQGLESYTSSRNLLFLERTSGFEAFLQEFDPGVWIFNDAFDQRLTWACTVHRIDPSVQKAGEFGKGDVAVTGRIAGLPIYENEGRCLLHLGASYQYHSNPFNTAVNERTYSFAAPPDWRASYFTPTFVSTGTFLSDHINQYGLEGLMIWGPLRVQAEYFGVDVANVRFPTGPKTLLGGRTFNSGYVCAAYMLTGENHRYDRRLGRIDRFIPSENFFLVKGEDGGWQSGRGAWEVAARYDWIDLNDGLIQGGLMNNYTVGLNWYLNPHLKCQWNYTLTDRNVLAVPVGGGAGGPSGNVHAIGMRVQWEF